MKSELRVEFIGKQIDVDGIRGRIINETKNMIVIKTKEDKIIKVIKKNHCFEIKIGEKYHKIKGSDIDQRPEDRIRLKMVKR